MPRHEVSYQTLRLRDAVSMTGYRVLEYDAPLGMEVFDHTREGVGEDGGYIPAKYSVKLVLPGQTGRFKDFSVIFWCQAYRLYKNQMSRDKKMWECMTYNIPALEIGFGPTEWMWSAIERWALTYKSNPYQFDVRYKAIKSDDVKRLNKLKNRRW